MKRFLKYPLIILALVFFAQIAYSQNLTVTSGQDLTLAGATYNTITVNGNGKVTFNGNLTARVVNVETNGVMIVNGNLTVQAIAAPRLILEGTLIVTGDLTVQSYYGTTVDVENTGTLVVGGEYDFKGGYGGSNETGDGDVYLSDPDDWGYSGGSADGDLSDLINATPAVLDEEILVDFIEESGYDTDLLPSADWQGDVSGSETDWDEAGNWASDTVPTSATNVTISSGLTNYASICSGKKYYTWNLTLEDNAELTIPSGSQVTILGDVNLGSNASLVVQNSNANPTSFIVYGDVTGDITFEWTYDNLRWWFIGHPISDANMTDYDEILTTDGGTNDYVLYDYQDPDVFAKVSKTAYDFSAQSSIKGYLFKVKNDDTPLSLTGTLNNDDVYNKALQSEWQILANPYSSYYQLPVESGANTDFEYTSGDVYVTVSTSNSDKVYHTFNTVSGIGSPAEFTGVISPGQAFYIKTNTPADAGQLVYMRASNRLHDNSNSIQLKSTAAPAEEDVLRVELANNENTDEAVIAFRDQGDMNFSRMDSEQRFQNSKTVSYIYSVKGDINAVINILPFEDEYIIPLGVKAVSGDHVLRIKGLNNSFADKEVYLEDKELGELILMTPGKEHNFTVEDGEINNRFIIHIKEVQQISTSIDDDIVEEESSEEQEVKVYIQNGNQLEITCDWNADNKQVSVFSVNGEEVFKDRFAGRTYNSTLSVTTGMYIIRVSGEQSHFQQKVLIK